MVCGEREGFQSIRVGRTSGMLHPHKNGIRKMETIHRMEIIKEPVLFSIFDCRFSI
jgi:hypothetical protein